MEGSAAIAMDPRAEGDERAAAWFGVALALVIGGLVRGIPLVTAGFPLNDGGLFATMISDLVAHGFLLPDQTSYNGLAIPFAYPPLGFYVAGGTHAILGVAITDTLRVLPFVFSLITIPAVYGLAASILESRTAGALAALSFALVPRAYVYLVSGGGITRAPGLLLAVLALGLAWRLARNPRTGRRTVVILGLAGGLTVLAHLQAALFLAVSSLVFLVAAAERRGYFAHLVQAGLIGVLAVLPWATVIVGNHGLDPLLSASASGSTLLLGVGNLLSLRFTELFFFDVISYVGLTGFVIAIVRRDFLLPVWLVATLLADARAGSTFSMVPLSLLVGYAVVSLVPARVPDLGQRPFSWIRLHPWQSLGTVALLVTLFMASITSAQRPQSPMHALNPDQREAMVWVGRNLPADVSLAVVTDSNWWQDAASEWLPAIALRRSAATVQGYEWLGGPQFVQKQDAHEDLQSCSRDVLPCVVMWAQAYEVTITHVFLPKGPLHGPFSAEDCCPALRHSLGLVPGARLIYDGPGATVIELPYGAVAD